MYIEDMIGCCAVSEIQDLGEHEGDAKGAMLSFCDQVFGEEDYWNNRRSFHYTRLPDAFYIFTAVVKNEHPGTYDRNGKTPTYGPEFAKFIKDNGLGALTESVGRKNRVNHPDHTVKVYVWAPNHRALVAWHKKNKPAEKRVE